MKSLAEPPLTAARKAGTISWMNLDRRLLNQIGFVRGLLAAAVLFGLLSGAATILQARQISAVVAEAFLRGQKLHGVLPLLWGLFAMVAARAIFSWAGEVAAGSAALRVKEHLRGLLVDRLLASTPLQMQEQRSGELVNTVTQGVEQLDAYFSQYLPQLALAGLLPVAYLGVVIPTDPLSGLALLLTGPLIPFFMFLIGSNAQKLTGRQWAALGKMSAYFLDTLQGLTALKILGRAAAQRERIASVSEQYREATMSVLRVTFLSALALELLSTIGTAVIAVEIGLRLLYGRINFESAFFVLLLAPEFYLPLRALGLRFHASMNGVSAARRIFAVLEEGVPAAPAECKEPAALVSLREPFTIALEAVSFRYPGREQDALDHISLSIPSGKTTALVGPSGSGKSTLTTLLLRFLEPDGGRITVNGADLLRQPVDGWRGQIAWVPQRPYLFHGTVAENLRIAKPVATEEEMRFALARAHLDGWLQTLPLGLETQVGEGGSLLSGGQVQRLALARAFLRDAPLLILDEPTAHLDVEEEQILRETTRRLCQGRTVLIIAHRLSTVIHADQIIVLEEGRVAESGTNAELLARGGAWQRMMAAYHERAV